MSAAIMAVITPDGIVGKIVEVFPATSQVLLINDKDSGVGALLADTRTHGVVKGSGDPDPRLDYVVNDEQVHAGEVILTSGEDRIFPKDLLIGTVVHGKPRKPISSDSRSARGPPGPSGRCSHPADAAGAEEAQRIGRRGRLANRSRQESCNGNPRRRATRRRLRQTRRSQIALIRLLARSPRLRPPRPSRLRQLRTASSGLRASRSPKLILTMSYMLNPGAQSESNIEVHKYYGGTVIVTAFLALVLQAFLHKYGRWSELIDLPLLVTVYFGVSRRNPVTGMFLGAAIGILQDALSHDNPIGLYGIAKTIVGYLASTVGARIDTQHPVSRLALIFLFFHFHQIAVRHHAARSAESFRAVFHAAPAAQFRRYRGVRRRPLRSSRSPPPALARIRRAAYRSRDDSACGRPSARSARMTLVTPPHRA